MCTIAVAREVDRGIFCLEESGFISSNNELASQAETWEQTSLYAPTPGNLDRHTPSVYCPSTSRLNAERSSSLPLPAGLGYHDEAGNGNLRSRQDDAQTYINYPIEYRALVNNRSVARATEKDVVLKPSSYWQQIKEKADQAVRQRWRKASNRHVRSDETTIVVSVNDRSKRDLTCNISFFLGGKSPSDSQNWTPNFEEVRASIPFAIATGRLDAT
ncbi:conserved hypothetical protein [Talaromyces stipitatus ATCC 10500]|uniref:Uncharacterized protein n=1 Tax=Talaromyces stipitatus (strain ATCC 10500 / CBS 375.48 / QM 6759 / NRRL 1006) TaxID=441959 RepID=B8LXU7_TALSN|nr:uncharacterized protein TSTA_062490 [Talaromyces stipitatus ATCC 10500]EED22762.1 conserved hypothetical protein [Talaromyces stipitatus ATCC 10500]